MKRITVVAVMALVAISVVVGGVMVAGRDEPAGITRTELGRGTAGAAYTISGDATSDVVVQAVTIQPGEGSGWHTHPGSEAAVIISGTLTFLDGDDPNCSPRSYSSGQVVVGPGHVHHGRNLGDEPVEIVVTYFDVPKGGAAASPAERPGHCPETPSN